MTRRTVYGITTEDTGRSGKHTRTGRYTKQGRIIARRVRTWSISITLLALSEWIIARTRTRARTGATNRTAWRTPALYTGWTRIASPWRVNTFCWARWTPSGCGLKHDTKENTWLHNNSYTKNLYFIYPLVWNWFFSGTKRFETISIIYSIVLNVMRHCMWSRSVYFLSENYMPSSKVYKNY